MLQGEGCPPELLEWNSAQSLPLTGVRDSNLLNLRCDYGGLSSALLNISEFIKVPEMGINVIFVIRARKKKKYYAPKSMSRIKNIILTGFF